MEINAKEVKERAAGHYKDLFLSDGIIVIVLNDEISLH